MNHQLGRLNQGLDLLEQQACRDGSPLPDGFWFIHAGLKRATKKLHRHLDRWHEDKHPSTGTDGPRLVS